jgi:hypothetical protein
MVLIETNLLADTTPSNSILTRLGQTQHYGLHALVERSGSLNHVDDVEFVRDTRPHLRNAKKEPLL